MASVRLFSAILIAVLATACSPGCERTCRKLDTCSVDGSTVTVVECADTCATMIKSFDRDDDDVRKESFAAHRRCVLNATCDELDADVCYDETLFAF